MKIKGDIEGENGVILFIFLTNSAGLYRMGFRSFYEDDEMTAKGNVNICLLRKWLYFSCLCRLQ